ncbi:hypothetical protein V2W45_1340913 [Cenococcum geophilum]
MKFTTSIVAFCAAFAAVSAQDVSGLPSCSLACFAAAIQDSGCSTSDTVCQCTTGKDKITASVTPCISKSCSADDAAKVLSAGNAICASALSSASTGGTTATMSGAAASGAASTATITSPASSGTGVAAAQTTNAAADVKGKMVGVGAAVVGLVVAVLAI